MTWSNRVLDVVSPCTHVMEPSRPVLCATTLQVSFQETLFSFLQSRLQAHWGRQNSTLFESSSRTPALENAAHCSHIAPCASAREINLSFRELQRATGGLKAKGQLFQRGPGVRLKGTLARARQPMPFAECSECSRPAGGAAGECVTLVRCELKNRIAPLCCDCTYTGIRKHSVKKATPENWQWIPNACRRCVSDICLSLDTIVLCDQARIVRSI